MKKTPGDIIILHNCTKNHDHMLYCSWDMAHDRCSYYFSFWAYFLPFHPPNSPKIQNFKKMKKKPGDIIIYKCVPKIMIRWCTVPQTWCATDRWKKWHIEERAPPKKHSSNNSNITKTSLTNLQKSIRQIFKSHSLRNTKMIPREHGME